MSDIEVKSEETVLPERRPAKVRITVTRPLAREIVRALCDRADRQADGDLALGEPTVCPDDLIELARAIEREAGRT